MAKWKMLGRVWYRFVRPFCLLVKIISRVLWKVGELLQTVRSTISVNIMLDGGGGDDWNNENDRKDQKAVKNGKLERQESRNDRIDRKNRKWKIIHARLYLMVS
jgi:hypothetical protein